MPSGGTTWQAEARHDDRNILANQAYNAFSAFPEDALVRIEPGDIRKKGKVPKNGSLFFTMFQTFMTSGTQASNEVNKVNEVNPTVLPPLIYPLVPDELTSLAMAAEAPARYSSYPPDFFDFIVIDECHRGGANDESTWRGILDSFAPAVQLGLTATPKRDENVDTYHYFGDPEWDGEPIEPDPCPTCGCQPCECAKSPPPPCPVCGETPCICPPGPCRNCGQRPCVCTKRVRVKVKLADGKERTIRHMMTTSFCIPTARAVHGTALRQTPRLFPGGQRPNSAPSGAHPIHARNSCRGWPRKASGLTNWPRCRRSSTPRRATCSTYSPTSPMPYPSLDPTLPWIGRHNRRWRLLINTEVAR